MAAQTLRLVTAAATMHNDEDVIVFNSATAIAFTLLPSKGDGREFILKNIGAGAVTLTPYGDDTIDDNSTFALSDNESISIIDYSEETWLITGTSAGTSGGSFKASAAEEAAIGITLGSCTTNGIAFTGAYGTHAINFDAATLSTTLIGAGSYGTPMVQTCTTGLINFTSTRAQDDVWNYGMGVYMKGTGEDVRTFGLGMQCEYNGTAGTDRMQVANFIAVIGAGGEAAVVKSRDGDGTAGVFATWHKVWMPDTCAVAASGARIGAIWADMQCYNGKTVNAESAAFFVTNGGETIDAIFWIDQASGYGFDYLFDFSNDGTSNGPVNAGVVAAASDSDGSLLIKVGATEYYVPYYAVGKLTT